MKVFKKLFLVIPMLFSIASCSGGEKTYAGTYSFQLGSDEGTHAGIHLKLTDDPAEKKVDDQDTKKFALQFDIGASGSSGVFGMIKHLDKVLEVINTVGIDTTSIDEIVRKIEEETTDDDIEVPLTINGYYYFKEVKNAKDKDETRLMMGIEFGETISIDEKLVEMVMYSTYANDTVNVVIPVSVEDFLFQLYWYGYRVAGLDSLTKPVALPEENAFMHYNQVGSHPTKEEVEEIQKYQLQREAKHEAGDLKDYELGEFIYNSYHDYHTLSMGLAKDGKK